mgnify:CR=1 FL=1
MNKDGSRRTRRVRSYPAHTLEETSEIAKAIYRRLHAPGAIDMLELADNRLKLVGLKCEENCPILNTTIRDLSNKFKDINRN